MNLGKTGYYIGAIIGLVVLLTVVAEMIPELETAGSAINATGIPFGTFFLSGGLLFLILAIGVFYVAYRSLSGGGK